MSALRPAYLGSLERISLNATPKPPASCQTVTAEGLRSPHSIIRMAWRVMPLRLESSVFDKPFSIRMRRISAARASRKASMSRCEGT